MHPIDEHMTQRTRRQFLSTSRGCLGAAALTSLLGPSSTLQAASDASQPFRSALGRNALGRSALGHGAQGRGALGGCHFPPKAKRVIYLFMAGGPSHIDLFDYKPAMRKLHGMELPASIRGDQRITGMTSGQESFPCVAPMFKFKQFGERGTWMNADLLPHLSTIADDLTIIRTMNTEAINHDPAITYINTGTQQLGRPSFGSWISYGLGSPNQDLPAYLTMISVGSDPGQALYSRLWGSGFLPSRHQGVQFRSAGDPVLYLSNPHGLDRPMRRKMLDGLAKLNAEKFDQVGDPEIEARIAQYEMAYRMQMSVPDLMNLGGESKSIFKMYGPQSQEKGTFASNCILARRMAERGVPFIQLFHRGWDQHGNLPRKLGINCKSVDQPVTALINDLKQRGLLEDTVVIFGGEFGRTIYCQGKLTEEDHGRDHHGRCFTTCVAGGGFKAGFDYGQTDDFSYNIVNNPVHINDLNATVMHCLGIDHQRFTVKHQGLDWRLTGVDGAKVLPDLLA